MERQIIRLSILLSVVAEMGRLSAHLVHAFEDEGGVAGHDAAMAGSSAVRAEARA